MFSRDINGTLDPVLLIATNFLTKWKFQIWTNICTGTKCICSHDIWHRQTKLSDQLFAKKCYFATWFGWDWDCCLCCLSCASFESYPELQLHCAELGWKPALGEGMSMLPSGTDSIWEMKTLAEKPCGLWWWWSCIGELVVIQSNCCDTMCGLGLRENTKIGIKLYSWKKNNILEDCFLIAWFCQRCRGSRWDGDRRCVGIEDW